MPDVLKQWMPPQYRDIIKFVKPAPIDEEKCKKEKKKKARDYRETATVNNNVKGLGGDDWTRWHIMMRNDQQNGYIPRNNDALGYYRKPVDFVEDDGCGIYELKLFRNRGQEERDNGCIHIHITSIALY